MDSWRNDSGRPLSSADWLENHHQAKLPERERFANRLVALKPRRIVDLGCGSGLWLELLHSLLPADCELIGIDSDAAAIKVARERAKDWNRQASFSLGDIEALQLPFADLFLCFNMFGYFQRKDLLLKALKERLLPSGSIAIRQFDGATMRFGRMDQRDRFGIDTSLYASVGASRQFGYYAVDDTLEAIEQAGFQHVTVELETFLRLSPFSAEFMPYLDGTAEWIASHANEKARFDLKTWLNRSKMEPLHYFSEVDLVCWIS